MWIALFIHYGSFVDSVALAFCFFMLLCIAFLRFRKVYISNFEVTLGLILFAFLYLMFGFCSFYVAIFLIFVSSTLCKGLFPFLLISKAYAMDGGETPELRQLVKFCFKFYRTMRDFNRIKTKTQFAEWLALTTVDYDVDRTILDKFVIGAIPAEPTDFSDFLNSARNIVDNWSDLLKSECTEKVGKMFFGILCTGLIKQYGLEFSKLGYTQLEEERIRRNHSFKLTGSGIHFIADTVLFFVETGYKFFTTGELKESLLYSDEISSYFKEFDSFKEKSRLTAMHDVRNAIAKGKSLIKRGRRLKGGHATSLVASSVRWTENKVEKLENSFNATASRKLPFTVLIYGPPGIGKSTLLIIY